MIWIEQNLLYLKLPGARKYTLEKIIYNHIFKMPAVYYYFDESTASPHRIVIPNSYHWLPWEMELTVLVLRAEFQYLSQIQDGGQNGC